MYTVDKLLQSSIERTPESVVIKDVGSGMEYTYQELNEIIDDVLEGLYHHEIRPGDRVAMCLRNSPEHVFLFLALQRLGAVPVPCNFRVNSDRLEYYLSDSDPEMFVFDKSIAEIVRNKHASLPCNDLVVVAEADMSGVKSFSALLDGETKVPDNIGPTPDDLSVIQYSSGTTGQPKGIKITHRGSVGRVLLNALGQHIYHKETMIGVMPLYHTIGLHGVLLSTIATSGTYIPVTTFDPERCTHTINQESVTALHEAPTIFKRILDSSPARKAMFESVDIVTYSGAPMNQDLFNRVKRVFDPTYLFNVYGMTEAYTPRTQLNLRDRDDPRLIGGSNVLHSTRVVEINSKDPSAVVDKGEEGELIVRMDSPSVFEGYWRATEEMSEKIKNNWYFSGDVGIKTEQDNFIVTGRTDNLIISGGENIYPEEIENALTLHPEVKSAAVVGKSDEEWGEVPIAYVTTSGEVSGEELDEYCQQSNSLADFKRPRGYEMITRIPRNASGKKLRHELK